MGFLGLEQLYGCFGVRKVKYGVSVVIRVILSSYKLWVVVGFSPIYTGALH